MAQAIKRSQWYLDDELSTLEAGLGTARAEAELEVLSALSNETRYTLVRVLVAANEELCVCELNAVVDVTESSLSHALPALVDAGLVEG